MNTSIITSQTNSLPYELIIKLVYYLDEKTMTDFITTCKYIKGFNFNKLLLPYRIIYDFDTLYMHKQSISQWFKKTLCSIYYNYNIKYHINFKFI